MPSVGSGRTPVAATGRAGAARINFDKARATIAVHLPADVARAVAAAVVRRSVNGAALRATHRVHSTSSALS